MPAKKTPSRDDALKWAREGTSPGSVLAWTPLARTSSERVAPKDGGGETVYPIGSSEPRAARVGDEVTFKLGATRLRGTVVEDRGDLGVGGRRLVRVSVGVGDDVREFELPADDVHVTS